MTKDMKSLIAIFLIVFPCVLVCGFMSSCSNDPQPPTYTVASTGYSYKIVVIEGCEYFSGSAYMGNDVLTHKGNCTNAIHRVAKIERE